jgi:hypothetical protein
MGPCEVEDVIAALRQVERTVDHDSPNKMGGLPGPLSVHAATETVIVLVDEDGSDHDAVREVVRSVRPGRAIFLERPRQETLSKSNHEADVDQEPPSAIRKAMVARRERNNGAMTLWWESIHLSVSHKVVSHLDSLVKCLLLPDLPRVLWLASDRWEQDTQDPLCGLADTVVVDLDQGVDSSSPAAARLQLAQRCSELSKLSSLAQVAEMSWERHGAWRDTIADLLSGELGNSWLRGLEHGRLDPVSIEAKGSVGAAFLSAMWLRAALGPRGSTKVAPHFSGEDLLSMELEAVSKEFSLACKGPKVLEGLEGPQEKMVEAELRWREKRDKRCSPVDDQVNARAFYRAVMRCGEDVVFTRVLGQTTSNVHVVGAVQS